LKFAADPKIVKKYELRFNMFPPRRDVATDKAWTQDPVMKPFITRLPVSFFNLQLDLRWLYFSPNRPGWPKTSGV
jgi:hypothetical protein